MTCWLPSRLHINEEDDRNVGSRGQDWQLLTAGAFVSMIVPVAVFLGLQRFFVRGLLAGSVKG